MKKEYINFSAMQDILKEVMYYMSKSNASLKFMDRFSENMPELQKKIMEILIKIKNG